MVGNRTATGQTFSFWSVLQTLVAGLILSSLSWTGTTVFSHGDAISNIESRLNSELAHIGGVSVRDQVVRLVQNSEFCNNNVAKLSVEVHTVAREHRELIVETAKSVSEVRSDCARNTARLEDWLTRGR